MKTKLDQFTMGQFIELLCGDTSVMTGKHEIADPIKLAQNAKNIALEYKKIADPAGFNSYRIHLTDRIKAQAKHSIFTMCLNLVALKQYDKARNILKAFGIRADSMSEKRLENEIRAQRARAAKAMKQKEDDQMPPDPDETRSQFDSLTASLMAHYKFQIETSVIKATVYAHLVARYNREVKARMAAMKKRH